MAVRGSSAFAAILIQQWLSGKKPDLGNALRWGGALGVFGGSSYTVSMYLHQHLFDNIVKAAPSLAAYGPYLKAAFDLTLGSLVTVPLQVGVG